SLASNALSWFCAIWTRCRCARSPPPSADPKRPPNPSSRELGTRSVAPMESRLMNDEQLTRLFRSLDEEAQPDAAFSDALFARLERETHGGGYRRRTSARWFVLAAPWLVAAAVGAAAAVGSGLVKLPFDLAVASATPEPS